MNAGFFQTERTEPTYWRSNGFSSDPTYYSTPLPEHMEAWSTATLLMQTVRMSISLSVW